MGTNTENKGDRTQRKTRRRGKAEDHNPNDDKSKSILRTQR